MLEETEPAAQAGAASSDAALDRSSASAVASPGETLREAAALGLVAATLTLALAAPYLWAGAVWTFAELDVLARARGALGEPLTGLEHSPWLPDALRARALGLAGGGGEQHKLDAAIRAPHVVCAALLVGLAAACARLWAGRATALAATAVALAAPSTLLGATTALGQPVLELAVTVTILACLAAHESRASSPRAAALVIAALGLVAGALSGGLVLGVAMPATVAAVLLARVRSRGETAPTDAAGGSSRGRARSRAVTSLALAVIAVTSAAAGAWLVLRQGFGYIPLLGASKYTDWVTRPWEVSVADGLESAALQMGPLAGFAIAGLVLGGSPRRRCGAWIAISLAIAVAWTFAYGRGPAPITVPTAVLAGHGLVATLRHLHLPAGRLAAFVGIAGAAIVAKDLTRIPELVIAIIARRQPRDVPLDDPLLGASQLSDLPLRLLILGVALVLAWTFVTQRTRWAARVSPAVVRGVPTGVSVVTAVTFAAAAWQGYVPRAHAQLSVAHHANTLREWDAEGLELGRLATTDRGLTRYGPTFDFRASTRPELAEWLDTETPRVAAIGPKDLPGLWTDLRRRERHLAVLSDPHSSTLLVGNVVPDDSQDRRPFEEIVVAKAPRLEHPIDLEFDGRVKVLGWEFTEPPRRGRDAELLVALEILRPIPSNLRMVTKLQQGRLSLAGREAFVPTEGALPPGNWRVGDIILVRRSIRLSRLEVLPGDHELVFALRRGEDDPLPITRPDPASDQATRPEATRPEATRPEATRPEATRPEGGVAGEVRVNARKTSAVIGTVNVR